MNKHYNGLLLFDWILYTKVMMENELTINLLQLKVAQAYHNFRRQTWTEVSEMSDVTEIRQMYNLLTWLTRHRVHSGTMCLWPTWPRVNVLSADWHAGSHQYVDHVLKGGLNYMYELMTLVVWILPFTRPSQYLYLCSR